MQNTLNIPNVVKKRYLGESRCLNLTAILIVCVLLKKKWHLDIDIGRKSAFSLKKIYSSQQSKDDFYFSTMIKQPFSIRMAREWPSHKLDLDELAYPLLSKVWKNKANFLESNDLWNFQNLHVHWDQLLHWWLACRNMLKEQM